MTITTVHVEAFTEAMTRLVAGLAVVTTRGADGEPYGLLVSSICSYSVQPPSVLVAIDRASRSYGPVVGSAVLGVHLLGREQEHIAGVFARSGPDKFARLDWDWDGGLPRLPDVGVYLRCATSRVFPHGDHAIVIADVSTADIRSGEPLVYHRRRMDWRLHAPR